MTNAITNNKLLEEPAYGDTNWNTPLNINISALDYLFGSSFAISVGTGGSQTLSTPTAITITSPPTTLTAPQWYVAQQWTITATGVMTTNATISIPSGYGGSYIVANNISSTNQNTQTVTLTVVGSGTAGIQLAAGTISYVYTDGVNMYLASNVGGGATGSGGDAIFYLNGQTVNNSYTIPSADNAGTFGPVTIASGATVTIPSTSTWTVV